MSKVKLKKQRFLDWYFTEPDDYLIFAKNIISELRTDGKAKTSIRELLDGCGELPNYIMEDHNEEDEDAYYCPTEIKLID